MEAGLCIPARAPSISSLACCAQAEQGTPSHHSRTHARKAKSTELRLAVAHAPRQDPQTHSADRRLCVTLSKHCQKAHPNVDRKLAHSAAREHTHSAAGNYTHGTHSGAHPQRRHGAVSSALA
eukprot:1138804-Pelagomonas_calceolata.AAC.7